MKIVLKIIILFAVIFFGHSFFCFNLVYAEKSFLHNYPDKPLKSNVQTLEIQKNIRSEYNEAYWTMLAAFFSAGAYHDFDESIEKQYLKDYGWNEERYVVETPEVVAVMDLCSKNAFKPDERSLKELDSIANLEHDADYVEILAIKGTSTVNDWHRNFLLSSTDFDLYNENVKLRQMSKDFIINSKIRVGYENYLLALLSVKKDGKIPMLKYLADDLKKHPYKTLIITGHSAGGALATLYGELLAGNGVSKKQMKVITFGAPAVGNDVFVKYLGDKIDLLRVVTSSDPFPTDMASMFGRFKQFGRQKKYKVDLVYEDIQHPISVYIDYITDDYRKVRQKAIKAGAIDESSKIKSKLEPKVAIYVQNISKVKLNEEMPKFIDIAQEEMRKIFPNNVLVSSKEEAQKIGADYILEINIGICPLGSSDDIILVMGQDISDKEGLNVLYSSSAIKMKIRRRIVEATMHNIKKCKTEIKKELPSLFQKYPDLEKTMHVY